MKIGIVSDSHGSASRLKAALKALVGLGAEAIVHCGDIGSVECVAVLGRAGVPAHLVLGNMDRHEAELAAAAEEYGVALGPEVIEVPIGNGRHLVATHGHHERIFAELVMGQQFPYVCHGHTHRVRDEQAANTRVINPGALRHPKDPKHPTAAILDTDADTVEYIRVPKR